MQSKLFSDFGFPHYFSSLHFASWAFLILLPFCFRSLSHTDIFSSCLLLLSFSWNQSKVRTFSNSISVNYFLCWGAKSSERNCFCAFQVVEKPMVTPSQFLLLAMLYTHHTCLEATYLAQFCESLT